MMIPLTPSNHQLEDREQLNPDSSKVTSDPKSEGKHKRKKDKTRLKTGDTEEADDRIATDPDPSEDTSVVADQPPSKKSRRPGWKVVEMQATITNLTREVDTLKAALEQAQRIRRKDPPIPPASSSTRSTTTSTRWTTSPLLKSGRSNHHRLHHQLRFWKSGAKK